MYYSYDDDGYLYAAVKSVSPDYAPIYDEWYWGEEREADLNPGGTGATTYKFTWGDEEIIW